MRLKISEVKIDRLILSKEAISPIIRIKHGASRYQTNICQEGAERIWFEDNTFEVNLADGEEICFEIIDVAPKKPVFIASSICNCFQLTENIKRARNSIPLTYKNRGSIATIIYEIEGHEPIERVVQEQNLIGMVNYYLKKHH